MQLLDRFMATNNEEATGPLSPTTTTTMASDVEGGLDTTAVCAVTYELSVSAPEESNEETDIVPLDPSIDGAAAAAAVAAQHELDSASAGDDAALTAQQEQHHVGAMGAAPAVPHMPALVVQWPTLPPTVGPSVTVPVVPVDPPASKEAVAVEADRAGGVDAVVPPPPAGAEADAGDKAGEGSAFDEKEEKGLWGLSIPFLAAVAGGGGGGLLLLVVILTIFLRHRCRAAAAAAGADPSLSLELPASTYGGKEEAEEAAEPTMSSPFYVQGVPIHKIDLSTPAPRSLQQAAPEHPIEVEQDHAPTQRTFRLQLPRRVQRPPLPMEQASPAAMEQMGVTMQRRGSWESPAVVRDEVPHQYINVIRKPRKR